MDAQRLEVVDTGSRSRVLITTREGTVATRLKAEEIRLDTLSPKQAIQLLSDWYEDDVVGDAAAAEVAKECGYLPLALAVCGAMARDGNSWADIAEGLRQADLSFLVSAGIDPKHESVLRSIDASVKHLEASKPDLARRYRDLAVFPADKSVPESVVAMLWADTKYLPHQARLELSTLENKSLLTLEGTSPNRRVSLHDLQHDYLKGTHTALKDAHQKLLLGYHHRCGGVWANQEDDGYFYQHLAHHLRMADREDEARALLLDCSWLQAKLNVTGILPLIADYEPFSADEAMRLIQWALRLSAPHLVRDRSLLRSQLHGRLLGTDLPDITHLLDSFPARSPWLRPLTPSLNRPGGELLQSLEGHVGGVNAVAVTTDGRLAVSASSDGTLKLWDLQAGDALRTLTGHGGAVLAVAVTTDGRRAVSASDDHMLKLWDLETGDTIRTLTGHDARVNAVAVTTNGRRAVSASSDGTLKLWDLQAGDVIRTLTGHDRSILAITLTPDGRRAVSASFDGTLKLWDLEDGDAIRTLTGHGGGVFAVAVTPDGRRAVSASFDGTLKLWDLQAGDAIRTLTGHGGWVNAVAVTTEGRRAISASSDGTLKLWDIQTGDAIRTLTGHNNGISAVAVTPDGRRAISASFDGTLKLWDLETGDAIRTLTGRGGWVFAVAVTPDGRRAVSASFDGTLKLWDLEAGDAIRTLTGHGGGINAVAVSTDGRHAVSASDDHTLKLWDLEANDAIRTLWDRIKSMAGRLCGNLEAGTATRTMVGHNSCVRAVAVTPDGRRAISASDDRTLKLWDLETGDAIRTLTGHYDSVKSVAVTTDGRRAVSASDDRTLRLWDLESGTVIATFAADASQYCCVVSPIEEMIISGDSGGRVHFLRWEGA